MGIALPAYVAGHASPPHGISGNGVTVRSAKNICRAPKAPAGNPVIARPFRLHQPQTGKLSMVMEHLDVGRIAGALGDCRQRGLDWLDKRTSNQSRVRATALQRLAKEYARLRQPCASRCSSGRSGIAPVGFITPADRRGTGIREDSGG